MKGWMKRENEMIACCSDGTRPMIFKIERAYCECFPLPDKKRGCERSCRFFHSPAFMPRRIRRA